MKATRIVRRIDDLGQVVIPKEIRRTLRIREGDPLNLHREGWRRDFQEILFPCRGPPGRGPDLWSIGEKYRTDCSCGGSGFHHCPVRRAPRQAGGPAKLCGSGKPDGQRKSYHYEVPVM